MKLAALSVLLVLAACSRGQSTATPVARSDGSAPAPAADAATTFGASADPGVPFALHVDDDAITFCDARGGRRLDPATGASTPVGLPRPCFPDGDPDVACGSGGADVQVRTPLFGPNDVVDTADGSYPLAGRVHDCAAFENVLVVTTGSAVLLLEGGKARTIAEVHTAADVRVALGAKWVAWIDGSTVHAAAWSASPKRAPPVMTDR